jgi:type 1 glutamine amidotransferase
MATTAPATASTKQRTLNVLLVSGPKDHGIGEHDYPAFQKRWTTLLGLADDVKVAQAEAWPTRAQLDAADVAVFYSANPAWNAEHAKDLDAFLAKGGGAIFFHFAVNGQTMPDALADRIGLAWGNGAKFRHGPVELTMRDTAHPITRGFDNVKFEDETYWNLTGDAKRIHVLADAPEENAPRPLLWTREQGGAREGGRVFVCILGHYAWTFDDPLFRVLLLRGICWSAHVPDADVDRLSHLATIGARVAP